MIGNSRRPAKKSKATEIFEYLHSVRMEDSPEFPEVENLSDNNGQPGDRSAAGKLIGGNKPLEHIPDRPNLTFTSMMPKQSSSGKKSSGILEALGNINLSDINDGVRAITGSPLVRSGALGLLSAGAMYAAYPFLDKPDPLYSKLYGGDQSYNKRRNWVTGLTGLGILAASIAADSHSQIPGAWYKYLPKKASALRKKSSMLGPADFIPIGFAQQAVMDSPTMTLDNKYRAIQMLNAMPGDSSTPVNSTDIVSAAVNTGSSAHGYPVGRATVGAIADALLTYTGAKAFGSENPGSIAAKVGLTCLGLRALGQMF